MCNEHIKQQLDSIYQIGDRVYIDFKQIIAIEPNYSHVRDGYFILNIHCRLLPTPIKVSIQHSWLKPRTIDYNVLIARNTVQSIQELNADFDARKQAFINDLIEIWSLHKQY